MSEFQVITQNSVNVTIYTELNSFGVEKRFPKDIFISELKNKLELITGYESASIQIKLLQRDKKFLCTLDDDTKMLGFYPCEDGHLLEVHSDNVVTVVEDPNFKRYELTEEEYAQKRDTAKNFKKNMKLGEYADGHSAMAEAKAKCQAEKIEGEKKLTESMQINDRCQVRVVNAPTRLGQILYLGKLEGKPGYFVGVKYDEPLGKNDGSLGGKRYFECMPNYGGFLKPDFVTPGNFPEENTLDDDEF